MVYHCYTNIIIDPWDDPSMDMWLLRSQQPLELVVKMMIQLTSSAGIAISITWALSHMLAESAKNIMNPRVFSWYLLDMVSTFAPWNPWNGNFCWSNLFQPHTERFEKPQRASAPSLPRPASDAVTHSHRYLVANRGLWIPNQEGRKYNRSRSTKCLTLIESNWYHPKFAIMLVESETRKTIEPLGSWVVETQARLSTIPSFVSSNIAIEIHYKYRGFPSIGKSPRNSESSSPSIAMLDDTGGFV